MVRILFVAIGGLLVLGLLLGACAPGIAPTPPPTVSTPTPVSAAPAATPSPQRPTPTPVSMVVATPTSVPAPRVSPAPSKVEPQYGGILNIVMLGDIISFDVHQELSSATVRPLFPIYNLLVRNDPQDEPKIIPDLAEKWEISPDGKVYTFFIRKGVKFHDGMPLTSADVKATFERIVSPPKGVMSQRKDSFPALEKVETPDAYTVRFVLKFPQASFLQMVALPFNVVMPKHILDKKADMKKDALGTGPFKFKSYMRSVTFEAEKNPDYFIPGRPYLEGLRWFPITDMQAIDAAFITQRVLVAHGAHHPYYGPLRKKLLDKFPEVKVYGGVLPSVRSATFNLSRKPWDDVRMRRALHLALDRQAMIDVAVLGDGVSLGFLAPGLWAVPEEELLKMPGWRQPKDADIAEAKRLVAEAGYVGVKSIARTRNWPQEERTTVMVGDAAKKIGIELQVQSMEGASFYASRNRGDFDIAYASVSSVVSEPEAYLPGYVTGGAQNWGGYSNPKVDDLAARQMRTADPVERKKLLLEIQRILAEDVPVAPLYANVHYTIWWPHVKGFYGGTPHWLGSNKFQDVWLAK